MSAQHCMSNEANIQREAASTTAVPDHAHARHGVAAPQVRARAWSFLASVVVHCAVFAAFAWMTVESGVLAPDEIDTPISISIPLTAPEPTNVFDAPALEPNFAPDFGESALPTFDLTEVPTDFIVAVDPAPLGELVVDAEIAPTAELPFSSERFVGVAWSQGNVGVGSGGAMHGAPHSGSGPGPALGPVGSGAPAGGSPSGVPGGTGQGAASAPVHVPVESAPRALVEVPIEYPKVSRRLLEEGTVEVRIFVASDGSVTSTELVKSSGHARLDEAALAGVKTWRFMPAKRDGVPFDSSTVHRITFRLEQAP